jgi:hypothetical protein
MEAARPGAALFGWDTTSAQDWGQVLTFEGKNGPHFRAFLLKTFWEKDKKSPLLPCDMAVFPSG